MFRLSYSYILSSRSKGNPALPEKTYKRSLYNCPTPFSVLGSGQPQITHCVCLGSRPRCFPLPLTTEDIAGKPWL